MAMNRTITAPGVEIREFDRSDYTSNVQQTGVLVTGFASQGEENTTVQITSKSSLINQFGKPTNEAERYFYTACNEVLTQGGVLFATRLPYDNEAAGKYNIVKYKVDEQLSAATTTFDKGDLEQAFKDLLSPRTETVPELSDDISGDTIPKILISSGVKCDDFKFIGYQGIDGLSATDVDLYITKEKPVDEDDIIIIDKLRGQYSKSVDGKECIGIIPVITTATNALYYQDLLNWGTDNENKTADIYKFFSPVGQYINYETSISENDSDAISVVTSKILEDELAIKFASNSMYEDTVSRLASRQFPAIGYLTPDTLESEHFKKIGVVIFKAYVDNASNNQINFQMVESFVGSLDKDAVDFSTGNSVFIDTIVNTNSEYIYLFSNVPCSDTNTIFAAVSQPAASLGFNSKSVAKTISQEKIFEDLNIIFEKNSDINDKSIDIVVDAGITNIAAFCEAKDSKNATEYDPFTSKANLADLTKPWLTTVQKFDSFCKNIRKDCMFVCDGLRRLCLQGSKKIIRPSKPTNTIDGQIIPNVKYICGLNSNYTAGYCDWFEVADDTTGDLFWCPPSIQATGCYIYTDINYNVWDAPAGQRRGIITAVDCAFSPSLAQAGAIYDKSWNYAINYADIGLILEGQKTMQQKQSAFDRVNVRRLFLRLEKQVYQVARTFVYEPNNEYTRQRFVSMLDPIFANVKANGGCYDYMIICDESINNANVIDNNELRVKIGVKPTKTSEFVLVEFYALRTGGSWDEMGA